MEVEDPNGRVSWQALFGESRTNGKVYSVNFSEIKIGTPNIAMVESKYIFQDASFSVSSSNF